LHLTYRYREQAHSYKVERASSFCFFLPDYRPDFFLKE